MGGRSALLLLVTAVAALAVPALHAGADVGSASQRIQEVGPTPTPTPTPTQAPCDDSWRKIDSDDRRSGNFFMGIAVRSADKVWGAGSDDRQRTLIRRWTGSRWIRERSPNSSGQYVQLNDVDAGRRGAVFAVGNESSTTMRTFALKRGSAGWRRMSSVDPGAGLSSFDHVSVISRRKAWAVGTRWDAAGNHLVLIERWNGRRWSVEPVSMNGLLHGIHARTPKDVWAVGRTVRNGQLRTLTLHFNGRRWRRIPSPNVNTRPHILNAVHASGRNDAWAVGYHYGDKAIAMHWNGDRWRLTDLPDLGGRSESELRGVSTFGNEVVAVGYVSTPRQGFESLVLQRKSSGWVHVDTERFEDSIHLEDVEHTPGGAAFAGGYRSTSNGSETMLARPPLCR